MLLMANPSGQDQAALFQLCKFALRSSRARARVANELRRVEATLRLAEKHTQNALLCPCKKRICQAFSTGSTRTDFPTQYGHNHALFGHDNSSAKSRGARQHIWSFNGISEDRDGGCSLPGKRAMPTGLFPPRLAIRP